MKKKVHFNLLDAAIIAVAVLLVLSFIFRNEIVSLVSGTNPEEFELTFEAVLPESDRELFSTGEKLFDGEDAVFCGRVNSVADTEGARLPDGFCMISVNADMKGYGIENEHYAAGGTKITEDTEIELTVKDRKVKVKPVKVRVK